MANPPTVTAADCRKPTLMEVTDFQFLMLVAPDWAAQLWNTFASFVAPQPEQRIHTGYQPKAARRAVRHRRHCDGLHFNRGAVAA